VKLNGAALLAALLALAAIVLPVGLGNGAPVRWHDLGMPGVAVGLCLLAALATLRRGGNYAIIGIVAVGGALVGASAPLAALDAGLAIGPDAPGLWLVVAAVAALAWRGLESLAQLRTPRWIGALVVPGLFGLLLLWLWQVLTVGFDVPSVLLPSPARIGHQLAANTGLLWQDFRQTFLKSVLAGFTLGSGAGFVVAILVDRSPFLQRGLLPLGSLVSAIPIVGIAPIMVMWFGFDWPSKAAVIVVMTFFPMLVNTLAGLAAAGDIERDLMHSYGAGYGQTLRKLRLPSALPFIFNALKINSTLALIGGIVAEFFGTPVVGLGFRISVEIGRMNVDMVWATIAVAALAGSMFYGVLALIERGLTFWHPSYRQEQG
jgi:NitT/TauT family transport system permease protein